MKDKYVLLKEDFDALLALFSDDREAAGAIYEKTRAGLIKYFDIKACENPQELADETLSRVAAKAVRFDPSRKFTPSSFVFGFAKNVYLETTRNPRRDDVVLNPAFHTTPVFLKTDLEEDDEGEALTCLDQCLEQFSPDDRSLIIRYYSKEKIEKINMRKRLAAESGCNIEALHVRVSRLRKVLKECVSRCREAKRAG